MGERLRRRVLSSVLFVFIREIRGSNSQHLAIRAGGFGFFDRMIDDRMMEKWIGCSAAMGKPDDLRFARKATAIQRSAGIHEEWVFLTTNRMNFHEWGSGFAGEFHLRFYSCLFARFVFRMCRVGTSGQEGLIRFPGGSGCLTFSHCRCGRSRNRAVRGKGTRFAEFFGDMACVGGGTVADLHWI